MSKKPLKATDKRRNLGKQGIRQPEPNEHDASPLAKLFHDRRKKNGSGKKAF